MAKILLAFFKVKQLQRDQYFLQKEINECSKVKDT